MTIRYEDVVADLEGAVSRLLRLLRVAEWEAGCLDFSASRRIISTMSTVQARRPVSAFTGRDAPVRFAHLSPLVSALRDAGVDVRSDASLPRAAPSFAPRPGRASPVRARPAKKKRRAEARRQRGKAMLPGSELRRGAEEEEPAKRVVDLRERVAVAQRRSRNRREGTSFAVDDTTGGSRSSDVVDAAPDREVLVDDPLHREVEVVLRSDMVVARETRRPSGSDCPA